MGAFNLVVAGSVDLGSVRQGDGLVTRFAGLVRYQSADGPADDFAGRVRAYRVHVGLAAEGGTSGREVCMAHAGGLAGYADAAFADAPGRYSEAAERVFGPVWGDCLVLDHVVLRPKWRRLGIGRTIVRRAVAMLGGGCGLVVCLAKPLVAADAPNVRVPADWLSPDHQSGEYWSNWADLKRFVRGLGFSRLPDTPLYALAPWSGRRPRGGRRAGQERR